LGLNHALLVVVIPDPLKLKCFLFEMMEDYRQQCWEESLNIETQTR